MRVSRHRLSRFLTDAPSEGEIGFHSLSDFYREEFLKCQRCLEAHREFYSADTISEVERALSKVMSQLDRLCTKGDADLIVGDLLRQFDVLTRLSVWSDPRHVH
jgi:hypothetical protein